MNDLAPVLAEHTYVLGAVVVEAGPQPGAEGDHTVGVAYNSQAVHKVDPKAVHNVVQTDHETAIYKLEAPYTDCAG